MARTLREQTNSLASYLPTGRAWAAKNIDGTVARGLLAGLSGELLRNAALVEEFRQEILPDETLLFVDEWERAVGIPDRCFTGSGTLDERRADVLAKLASLGVQTSEDFRRLALQVYGIELTIRNPQRDPANTFPFTFNPTGEADPDGDGGLFFFDLSDREARFQIVVEYSNVPSALLFPLTFPIPFLSREIATIECLFGLLRPANVGFSKDIIIPSESPVIPVEPPIIPVSGSSLEFQESLGTWLKNGSGVHEDWGFPAADGQFSINVWARTWGASVGNLQKLVGIGDGTGSDSRFWLTHNIAADTFQFELHHGGGAGGFDDKDYTMSLSPPALGTWFMLTVTFDGTGGADALKMYLDGVLDASPTRTVDNDLSALAPVNVQGGIGANGNTGGGNSANHVINSVGTWDVALTQNEITAIFNSRDPALFDFLLDQGNYQSAANLKNWYLLGNEAVPNLGKDYGPGGVDLFRKKAVNNPDDDDVIGEVPF